jgi:hypothetical protein
MGKYNEAINARKSSSILGQHLRVPNNLPEMLIRVLEIPGITTK